jgi:hypothetical protein
LPDFPALAVEKLVDLWKDLSGLLDLWFSLRILAFGVMFFGRPDGFFLDV